MEKRLSGIGVLKWIYGSYMDLGNGFMDLFMDLYLEGAPAILRCADTH